MAGRSSAFSVTVDTVRLEEIGNSLSHLDDAALGRSAVTAVNIVAQKAFADAKAKMNAGINLPDSYLDERMAIELATDPAKPRARILARGRLTTLTQYGAQQSTRPVKFSNDSISPGKLGRNPRKAGSLLPWKLRVGNQALGIPVGMKQDGISVEVTRGGRKSITSVQPFFVRGRSGNLLVMTRKPGTTGKKRGDLKALYGPSVYQLFRAALDETFLNDVADRLGKTVVTLTADELKKALGNE
ncbi:phage tail protein [Cupriavidus sp. IK-TO18]|uniref:phage tail protein n=1 Tax=Cupriavidus sp. IK-TO18 TaxID=2782182 RepID=UPI00189C18B0|nr:phage tail protein [Cupriavidus sp. IK-TO18]MBF6987253.1 phage tail protein [Cupriavidus sp. IK-TO18]